MKPIIDELQKKGVGLAGQRSRLVITIDGPAGAGKSTTARQLASRLGYAYLDTGALYRAIAWKVHASGVDPSDLDQLKALLTTTHLQLTSHHGTYSVLIDSRDVTEELRTPRITHLASSVAAIAFVRDWLLPIQQDFGAAGDIVAEGRDIGTRVFPKADVKFFLEADLDVRTNRRHLETLQAGQTVQPQDVRHEIASRDERDRSREIAPLLPAPHATIIDTSRLTVEQVVDKMLALIPTQQ